MVKTMVNKKSNITQIPTFDNIDRNIHEPARFKIMAHLYVVEGVDYLFLWNQTELTQGNLSSHLNKLEKCGYIEIKKEFVNKKPKTMLYITNMGRAAFQQYRDQMKQTLNSLPE